MRPAAICLLLLLPAQLGAQNRYPDILFLVADDLGWNDVGWHNDKIRTPRLDTLVKSGIELDWHYVQPQCTPTRVALLTGNYPSRFGPHCTVASNEQAIPFHTRTLPKLLKTRNYRCGLFGKWHLGSLPKWGPNKFGFDYSYGSLAGACGIWDHRYRLNRPAYSTTWHRNHEFVTEEGHSLELCTDEAIRWVKAQPSGDPLFCYMPYHAVHTPLAEKDRTWFERNKHFEDPDRRHFAAYVSHLDDAIGRLVEVFKETKRYDNTIIVFTSDNGGVEGGYNGGAYPKPDPKLKPGFSSNKPLRGGKSTSYEGGIRVPAFVHWKKRLDPGKCELTMHAVDWLPTLLEWAEVRPKPELVVDGRQMAGNLQAGRLPSRPRTIYTTWNRGRQVGLRHGDWKIRSDGPGKSNFKAFTWELYNLKGDPQETSNLAGQNLEKLKELVAIFESERGRDGKLK